MTSKIEANRVVLAHDLGVPTRRVERQSAEADPVKRKKLVWEIERKLAEDGARPIIFYDRRAICWQPYVKGVTIMVNSVFSGGRMEDVWLHR